MSPPRGDELNHIRLKHLVEINAETLDDCTDPDLEFDYLDIGSVGRGRLIENPTATTFCEAPSRARRVVRPGDTIISTVRTYLRAALAIRHLGRLTVVSTGFAVLSPGSGLDPRYLGWLIQSDVVIDEVVSRSVGVSYPAINPGEIGDIYVPAPSATRQRAIASLLDSEIARIDAVIDKKAELAKALSARLQADIDHTTSRGVSTTVRRVAANITSGPRGWSDHSGEAGDPFIRAANLRRGSLLLRPENLARVDPPNTREARRSRVQLGDTLVGITGANTGWVGLVTKEFVGGYVSQHVARIQPRDLEPSWLAFSMSSRRAQEQLLAGQYGGTKQQLGLDDLAETRIHMPLRRDQAVLCARLNFAAQHTERVASAIDTQLELLRERRQAIITAAVTGQLDVTDAT